MAARQPVHSVLRALRHLVAYGSTNKYRPVRNCKASGITANMPTEAVYFFCAMATMLTMTATVKAMDSQRWVCRIHLFQFNVTSLRTSPNLYSHFSQNQREVGHTHCLRSTSIHDF